MTGRGAIATLLCAVAAIGLPGCGGEDRGVARPGPAPVVVWAVGDGGVDTPAARRVAKLVARDDPEHVVYLGDVYESGTAAEFESFASVYGELVGRMWPTPGNHEWPAREEGYAPFWQRIRGRPLPYRYAREAGGWQLLSATSEDPTDPEQLAWLRDHAGTGDCRIAFWHRPRFNAGEHRDEEADVAPLWDAVEGHAAIVLSGHDHDLQRFEPAGGTVQYVSGAGGKSHYAVAADDPRLAWSDDEADGALRIALTPGRADLRFVTADGTVIDRSTVTCRG